MDENWIQQQSMGGNTYLLTQQLIDYIRPFNVKRILDLGCGKCVSSVLLAEQLGAEVWAIDKQMDVAENYRSVSSITEQRVIPLQLDADHLPFPPAYFDCIIAVSSIYYFGTDDKFWPYICHFLKQDGIMAITDICFTREVNTTADIPPFLKADFPHYFQHVHSLEWWKNKWAKTGLLDISVAEHSKNAGKMKAEYIKMTLQAPDPFTLALQQDHQEVLGFFALIGVKNALIPFLEV